MLKKTAATYPHVAYYEIEYDRAKDWLANQYRNGRHFDINLAPDDWNVIAVNDPARVQVQ